MNGVIRSICLVAAVVAAATLPGSVLAAPAAFEGLVVTCPGYGQTTVTSPGNGAFAPGFLLDGHDLLIPYRVDYTLSSDGGSVSGSDVKGSPIPLDAITCTFDVTFHIGATAYGLVGSLTAVVRGQP